MSDFGHSSCCFILTGVTVSEAAEELLQNLTLDSDNEKPLQATETTMKVIFLPLFVIYLSWHRVEIVNVEVSHIHTLYICVYVNLLKTVTRYIQGSNNPIIKCEESKCILFCIGH